MNHLPCPLLSEPEALKPALPALARLSWKTRLSLQTRSGPGALDARIDLSSLLSRPAPARPPRNKMLPLKTRSGPGSGPGREGLACPPSLSLRRGGRGGGETVAVVLGATIQGMSQGAQFYGVQDLPGFLKARVLPKGCPKVGFCRLRVLQVDINAANVVIYVSFVGMNF
jgi:hypothetical protein